MSEQKYMMHLSKEEALVTHRRRNKETQKFAAKKYKVSFKHYCSWERYGLDYHSLEWLNIPDLREQVGLLNENETCFILRQRNRLTLPKLADLVGVCRYWLNKMETGKANNKRLIDFWKNRHEWPQD